MGLKETLQEHGVPIGDDFDERMDLIVAALKRSPMYETKKHAFEAKQSGGAEQVVHIPSDPEDFLTPAVQNFITLMTSPAAQGVLRSLFAVLFFVSYLEKLPVFGRILSAGLDIMLAGGKMLTKTLQRNIPPALGLLPIPYASMVGLMFAALLGMMIWPLIALVALSRQDFTMAVESMVRIIPPPFGDTIADLFLEGNRAIAKLNDKREKLVEDIKQALEFVTNTFGEVSDAIKDGATSFQNQLPAPTPVPTGGQRLSRRRRGHSKWRTPRKH